MADYQDDEQRFNDLKQEWGFGKESVEVYGKIKKFAEPSMNHFLQLTDIVSAKDGTRLIGHNGAMIRGVVIRPGRDATQARSWLGQDVLATLELAPFEIRQRSSDHLKLNARNLTPEDRPDFVAIRLKRFSIEKINEEHEKAKKAFEKLQADIDKTREELESVKTNLINERQQESDIKRSIKMLKKKRDILGLKPDVEDQVTILKGYSFFSLKEIAETCYRGIRAKGGIYRERTVRDFTACLATHDIVVLAGSSGSGKTSFCREYARMTGSAFHLIPVKPNWTGSEDLLGYWSPVDKHFQKTPFLEAILEARKDPDRLHLICLDEMNLARPEYYFADFLSLLEERKTHRVLPLNRPVALNSIVEFESLLRSLMDDKSGECTEENLLQTPEALAILCKYFGGQNPVEALQKFRQQMNWYNSLEETEKEVLIPENVRFVGTVNIDETTNFFSPKILDRVHVIRMENPLFDEEALSDTNDYNGIEAISVLASCFGTCQDYPRFDRSNSYVDHLLQFARVVFNPIGMEISLRVIRQSMLYVEKALAVGLSEKEIFGLILEHKVFPQCVFNADDLATDGKKKMTYLEKLANFSEVLGGEDDSVLKTVARLKAMGRKSEFINWWL